MTQKKAKRITDIDQAHGMAFVEDEARTYPDLSWLVPGAGSHFCRPCRLQFSVGGSFAHDDAHHPEKVARRAISQIGN
jgi:hypothetical protein